MPPAVKEILILIVGLVVLGLLLLTFVRKAHESPGATGRQSRRSSSGRSSQGPRERELVSVEEKGDGRMRRKFRKRRRTHRPRNPSLAETGGLPPQRHDSADLADE